MKRISKIVLFLCIFSLVLSACSQAEEPTSEIALPSTSDNTQNEASSEEKVEVAFVFWAIDPSAEKGWEETFAAFEAENPNIDIKLIGAQGASWGEYLDKVATLIAGGQELDIISTATEGMRFLAGRDLIRPIDDLIEQNKDELQEFLDDVSPALMDAMTIDGKIYGFPFSWNNMVMWYRPSHFTDAGLNLPAENWTKDDFVNYAKKLTSEGRYGYATDIAYFAGTMPWQFAYEAELFNEDYSESYANDPKNVEVMQFLTDLIQVEKVAPDPMGINGIAMLQAGQVSMYGAGRWPIMSYALDSNFTDYDVQLWPKWTTQVTEFGVDCHPIMSSSKNLDAAFKAVMYLNKPEVQSTMLGTINKSSSNLPARRSLALSEEGNFMPNYKLFYNSLDNGKLVPAPPNFTAVENIWTRYVGLMLSGEVSVIEALDSAKKELDQALID